MSEYINNREYRQKVLKELIMELHNGKSVEEVKERFGQLIEGVSATEISAMETALISEGMPVTEVQRLCDVHAAVFKGSIEEIHRPEKEEDNPGHPVFTFRAENRAIERLLRRQIRPVLGEFLQDNNSESHDKLNDAMMQLWELDKHYLRKENLLFPYMEKYGITAPPKVMWGVDDEIRADIKEVIRLLKENKSDKQKLGEQLEAALGRVEEMIFKEENILFPMVLETLSEDEWLKIAKESTELGYCLYEPKQEWRPVKVNVEAKVQLQGEAPAGDGYINFDTGLMSQTEIEAVFNTLPVDITFVDKDGAVKFFTQGKERIFPRTKAVIGRQVSNCHPPASVHIVEEIVEDLKSGKKDHEDFWIRMRDKYVHIRYFAVRDKDGNFLGVLEFTQDIAPIKELEGEKRLVEKK
jgi:PAS domain S-box-containing protein